MSLEDARALMISTLSSQIHPAERPCSLATEGENPTERAERNKRQDASAAVSPWCRFISNYEPIHRQILLT